jgi:hypothetical protein
MISAGARIVIVSLREWLVDENTELHVTDYYSMERDAWYAQFLSRSIEWDLRAAKQWNKDVEESSVRNWHVEGDKEFDDLVESGSIRY